MKIILAQDDIDVSEIMVADGDLINGNALFIGRGDDCHILLDDVQISRTHTKIYVEDNNLYAECLATSGDLRVDGITVKKTRLEPDSVLTIGRFSLKLQEHGQLFDKLTLEKMSDAQDIIETNQESEALDKTEVLPAETEILPSPVEEEAVEEPLNEEEQESDPFEEESSDDNEDDDYSFDDNLASEESEDNDSEFGEKTEQNELDDRFENDSFDSDSNEESFDDGFENNDGGFDTEESGFDDGFGGGDSGEDKTQVFTGFANFTLRIFGEYAPFDKYNIVEQETFIGRDEEKCQIVLDDPEVSSVHAVIKKTALNCVLEDLDSSNGTLINGERINSKQLVATDEFLIGTTSFTVEVRSDLIEAEKDRLMPVDQNQEIEVEEIIEEEVSFDDLEDNEDDANLSLKDKILKNKKLVYGIAAIAILMVLFSEEEKKPEKPRKKTKEVKEVPIKPRTGFSPEQEAQLEQNYELALSKFQAEEYYEAKEYLQKVFDIDKDGTYRDTLTLSKLINEGYEEIIRLKNEAEAEKERKQLLLKVKALLEKAQKAVKDREVEVAENYFTQILELDPENIDVAPLKIEIQAYKDEIQRKADEKARAEAIRRNMVEALQPGKSLYLKGKWYDAINKLTEFLEIKKMDEDLIAEGTKMLKESQQKLLRIVNPLRSKARSFKEGQDLKQAYEAYGEVLEFDPSDEESLNEREAILKELKIKSRKLYREGLIAESLSSFSKAKEKFQEVKQISPVGSEYYIKASNKIDSYLE